MAEKAEDKKKIEELEREASKLRAENTLLKKAISPKKGDCKLNCAILANIIF